MPDPGKDSEAALTKTIRLYNEAWNAHDLDAIVALHAPDMVFENHTAGESASGTGVRGHIASIFANWPDLRFTTRRLYVREGLVVQEWTADATHSRTLRLGNTTLHPTGRSVSWPGIDAIPFEDGLVKRKDVYSGGGSIAAQLGLRG